MAVQQRWTIDHGTGAWVPPPLVAEFCDWLVAELRTPADQAAWAEAHDVAVTTIRTWKKDDRFRSMWEDRVGSRDPGKIKAVLDNLHQIASSGTGQAAVSAAKQYMEMVGEYTPASKVQIAGGSSLGELTDEQLQNLLASMVHPDPGVDAYDFDIDDIEVGGA